MLVSLQPTGDTVVVGAYVVAGYVQIGYVIQ